MAKTIKVAMADLQIAKAPDCLTTLGLGSCIGLTLYDPVIKVGGLVHYMLPDSTKLRNNTNIAKFGDTGIKELYNQMVKAGANPRRLVAKMSKPEAQRQDWLPKLPVERKCSKWQAPQRLDVLAIEIPRWQNRCFLH